MKYAVGKNTKYKHINTNNYMHGETGPVLEPFKLNNEKCVV